MGNLAPASCGCFEEAETIAQEERTEALQKGATFLRPTMLGMSSQKVFISLSENKSSLKWRVEKGGSAWIPGSADEYGEIALTEVDKLKAAGKQNLQVMAIKDAMILLDVSAEDVATRDSWVLSLNELLDGWKNDPDSRPLAVQLRATNTSDKASYYEKRRADLKESEKRAEERKMKYLKSGVTMKHTAQAMIDRPDPAPKA